MKDYSNPDVMKQVTKEAEQLGIFAIGVNPIKVIDTYILKVKGEDESILNMFNKNKEDGYKLIQIDFIGGLSSLIKQNKLIITKLKKNMFSFIFELKIETIKDKADRAWARVKGKPLVFIFQSKDGFIEIIEPKQARQTKSKEVMGE